MYHYAFFIAFYRFVNNIYTLNIAKENYTCLYIVFIYLTYVKERSVKKYTITEFCNRFFCWRPRYCI